MNKRVETQADFVALCKRIKRRRVETGSLRYWLRMVAGSTAITSADSTRQDFVDMVRIARACRDEGGGTWHQSAKYFGTKCHCAKCAPEIKRYC